MLEVSPWPLDLNLWIQGLLPTYRNFMVTPIKAQKSSKSWLGRIYPIWQEFESIKSLTFGITKLLLHSSEIGIYLAHPIYVLDKCYISQRQEKFQQLTCWIRLRLTSCSVRSESIFKTCSAGQILENSKSCHNEGHSSIFIFFVQQSLKKEIVHFCNY
jgi:hypothetical protein